MPEFRYVVRNKYGKQIKGVMEAETQANVATELKKRGYTLISIYKERKPLPNLERIFKHFKRVKLSEKNVFTRQLVTLIRAGVPLVVSLDVIRQQTSNSLFKKAIGEIIRDIKQGSSLSKSLAKHPNCFDKLYVDMVKAGEEGGILDDTLERLADLGEHEDKVRRDIKAATRYPILVILALIIGFIILVVFVLPKYTEMFSRFNAQLPLPTRLLIQINHIIVNYWYIIIAGVGFLVFVFYKFISTPKGSKIWDSFKIKVPVLGDLVLKLTMSRFTRAIAVLMKTGVPILKLLELVIPSIGNKVVEEAVQDIKKRVREGKDMAGSIKSNPLFPPIVTQMIAIGEETGKIDELLFKVSEYYDSQTDYLIENLTTLIEPFMILILGLMVLFIALAVFLPMVNLMALFR